MAGDKTTALQLRSHTILSLPPRPHSRALLNRRMSYSSATRNHRHIFEPAYRSFPCGSTLSRDSSDACRVILLATIVRVVRREKKNGTREKFKRFMDIWKISETYRMNVIKKGRKDKKIFQSNCGYFIFSFRKSYLSKFLNLLVQKANLLYVFCSLKKKANSERSN